MKRKPKPPSPSATQSGSGSVSLRDLAASVGLSPTTVSLVLNQSPGSKAIPQETKDRIIAAARKLKYRPNFLARSLRAQRTYSVGVLVPELSEGYSSLVVSGIEEALMKSGYLYLATSHRHSSALVESIPRLLWERRVEGLILVDTPYPINVPLPVVSVSGHRHDPEVTNIVLDHDEAAKLGIRHLFELGHRRVAVIKGQEFSSDTEVRWQAIERAARQRGIPIEPELVVQLEGDSPSPEVGYAAARVLLKRNVPFTAVFAFNDVSAVGAIRAFQECGLHVPEAVSVVGFDDIWSAAFHIPALTTIRQPLRKMGSLAAETLLARIESKDGNGFPAEVRVAAELITRESTGPASPELPRTLPGRRLRSRLAPEASGKS